VRPASFSHNARNDGQEVEANVARAMRNTVSFAALLFFWPTALSVRFMTSYGFS
jgi:hypothetical protein